MKNPDQKPRRPGASRRGFLLGLVAGAGASVAVLGTKAKAQGAKPAAGGPILFHRTAETARYYKTVLPR